MRLNLFKSIVFFLVLFASGFIIAHADQEISLGGCRYLINCREFNGTFCSSLSFYIYRVEGIYQTCPNCGLNGNFGPFIPFCGGSTANYYGCSTPGPGRAYTKAEWVSGLGTDYFNYNCQEQCSCDTPHCGDCNSDSDCTEVNCCYTPYTWYCETVSHTCQIATPILVDVDGDGFDLTDAEEGVTFNVRGALITQTAWTAANSDDAWLALDLNGNGIIDSFVELFGNIMPQPIPPEGKSKNGFLALAEHDRFLNGGNGDGQIDSRDIVFNFLRLWQDTNHNGISEPNELHSLSELGVAILDLDYKESKRTDEHGNQFKYRAKVRDVRGAHVGRWAWDVVLKGQAL